MKCILKMPTTTYNTGSASTSSPLKDEIILSRPSDVYNGECHPNRRSLESNSNSSNRATVDCAREHQARPETKGKVADRHLKLVTRPDCLSLDRVLAHAITQ